MIPVSLLAPDHEAVRWAQGRGWGLQTTVQADGPRARTSLAGEAEVYTLPLYHAMMGGSEAAQTLAKETFAATASHLHSNVVHYIQQIVAPLGS